MNKFYFTLAIALALASGRANAAGFEKSVSWSGKHAGYAAAAVSSVTGGQSLFFNPAGLAGPADISINYSPTFIKTKGYLISASREEESKVPVLPFGGVLASYKLDKLGFGMGAYVVGGEKAYYGTLDMSIDTAATKAHTPSLLTDLEIMEYSLGVGYELMPGLRVGANWRINKASGALSTIKKTLANTAYSFLYIKDLKQTKYDGWRVGVQYEAEDKTWGVGLSYRSRVKFDAPGTPSGETTVIPTQATTPQTFTGNTARVGLVLPEAINFGFHYAGIENFKIVAGVDFVKYSVNDNIYITGVANGVTLPNIPLNWHDMWNYRLGFEYTGIKPVALRAGYSLTSQVTHSADAKATLPPPGKGHVFTVGAGYALMANLDLDGAFEYAYNKGNGSMTLPTGTTKELLAGQKTDTTVKIYTIHTGITYKF